MRELIKKILREELSPIVKRRLNVLDMDKLVNLKKQISFNPRMSVDDNVKKAIRKISAEIYPSHNIFSNDEEYETSWELLIDALIKKYSDELTEYFTKRKEEYEITPPKPFTYTFVKHDENNAGFSQSFPNLESLIYQMGDYLPILDWYEVKGKLDKIDYFPNTNFTGTYSSNRMSISRAGDDGNNWGYSFSIIKSVPEEYLDMDTKKLKKNIQESIRRILREETNTKSTNKEFSKYKDSKFNSLRDYTLQDIVDNWESLSDHKNDNIKTIKHFVNNPDKITDLVYDEKGLEDGYHRLIAAKILKKPRFTYKMVEESIGRILREETYSPAGDEYTPGRYVVHKSNPVWRKNIKENGLQVSVGECYENHAMGLYGEWYTECQPAIFATDSLNDREHFYSTYDDDTWLINTECANVTWHKDLHFDFYGNKHIVTFENIPPNCLKLIHKGTGKNA